MFCSNRVPRGKKERVTIIMGVKVTMGDEVSQFKYQTRTVSIKSEYFIQCHTCEEASSDLRHWNHVFTLTCLI